MRISSCHSASFKYIELAPPRPIILQETVPGIDTQASDNFEILRRTMIRAVYTPHVACPPELRTYNDDGTRIERAEEGKSEVERLGYTYLKYDFLVPSSVRGNEHGQRISHFMTDRPRNESQDDNRGDVASTVTGLSGNTLTAENEAGKKGGKRALLKRMLHVGKTREETGGEAGHSAR